MESFENEINIFSDEYLLDKEGSNNILFRSYLVSYLKAAGLTVSVEGTDSRVGFSEQSISAQNYLDKVHASMFGSRKRIFLNSYCLWEIEKDIFSKQEDDDKIFYQKLTKQEQLFCGLMETLRLYYIGEDEEGILFDESFYGIENSPMVQPIDFKFFKKYICSVKIGEVLPVYKNLDLKNYVYSIHKKITEPLSDEKFRGYVDDLKHGEFYKTAKEKGLEKYLSPASIFYSEADISCVSRSDYKATMRAQNSVIENIIKEKVKRDDKMLISAGYPYQSTYKEYLRFLENNPLEMNLGINFLEITWENLKNTFVPFFGSSFPKRYQLEDLQRKHTYIVGRGGSGKTVLLRGIFQSLKKGIPRIVIDPHGDLADDLSCFSETTYRIAPHERPFVINPFEIRDKSLENRELVGQLITEMIGELVADVELSRLMETVIFPVVVTLLKLDYADFRMLADCINPNTGKDRLKSLRGYVDSHLLGVWGELEGKTYDTSKQSIFNRLQSLLNYRTVIQTLCGKDDFGEVEKVLHSGGEIVFSVPVPALGEAVAVTLGRFFVTRMQIWAKQRQKIPERERFPVYLMIDEFHNFISPVFASTLDQYGRKFGLFLMLAHQHIKQLGDSEIKGSILTNTQNKIVGMSNHETRQALQREMSADAEQFEGLRVGHFLAKFGEEEAIQIYCRNQRPFKNLSAPQYLPTRNTGELFNGWREENGNGDQNYEATEKPVTARAGGYTPKFDI